MAGGGAFHHGHLAADGHALEIARREVQDFNARAGGFQTLAEKDGLAGRRTRCEAMQIEDAGHWRGGSSPGILKGS